MTAHHPIIIHLLERKKKKSKQKGVAAVTMSGDIIVPPRSFKVVEVQVGREVQCKLSSSEKYYMEPKGLTRGIHIAAAVMSVGKSLPLFTKVINTTNQPYYFNRGATVGVLQEIVVDTGTEAAKLKVGAVSEEEIKTAEIINGDTGYRDKEERILDSDEEFEKQVESALEGTMLSANQINDLRSLLYRYKDCFAINPLNPGTTDAVMHSIDTGTSKPIKCAPARGSPQTQEIIKKSIDEMLEAKVIEPSRSPWASRVVIVKKKDGTSRFCVDYRDLNNVTIKDSYPIPYQTDLMDNISNAKYFSSLDLASGYWQIKLDEDAKPKSAFTTRYGLFDFLVMPFGLTNAPATFQRLMDLVLAGLTWIECMVYLDDIIIFSPTWHEHLKRLENVFNRLREYKLKAKMSKCQFGRREIKYLGHVLSAKGIATDPDKIKVIKNLPNPTNVTEVRSFLGMVGYYRRFIPSFAELSEPLNKLLKKNAKFNWTTECTHSVNQFKSLLISAPILRRPDFTKPFQIVCDASNVGIGAVLEQLDSKGEHYTIAYWSKTLNSAERNYHTSERELLAVVMSIKHFKHYVGGTKFIVYTDHNALTHLNTAKNLEGRLQRWALFLQEYNPIIKYRKGKDQGSADGLSRLGHDGIIVAAMKLRSEMQTIEADRRKDTEMEIDEPPVSSDGPYDPRILEYDTADRWDVHDVRAVDIKSSQIRQQYIKDQCSDPLLSLLRQQCLALLDSSISFTPSEREKVVLSEFKPDEFRLIHDLLYHITYDKYKKINLFQICTPSNRRDEIKRSLHENIYGGMHLGLSKCWDKLRNRYWWPFAYKELRNWILSCPKCQRRKARHTRAPLQPNLIVTKPWECVGVDILGPLPTTHPNKFKYIIVFVDHFTSWVEAMPLRDITATSCAEAFLTCICNRYGPPSKLLSDRGSQFLSTIADEVNKIMGIHKLNTTAYHPQTNGKVEKFNNTLVTMLAMYVGMKQNDWDKFIPFALFAYNTSKHELNSFSPYYLLYGREPNYMVDAMVRTDSDTFLSVGSWTRKIIRRIRRAHLLAERHQRRISNQYLTQSLAKPPPKYKPGDLVLMRHMRPMEPGSQKFIQQWHGPYEVAKQIAPVTYQIKLPQQEGKHALSYILHVNRLKPFRMRENDNDITNIESIKSREQLLREAMELSDRANLIRAAADKAEAERK